MAFNIHPSAAQSFDRRAVDLITRVKEIPPEPDSSSSFPTELHIAATITQEEIIGEPEIGAYSGDHEHRFRFIVNT